MGALWPRRVSVRNVVTDSLPAVIYLVAIPNGVDRYKLALRDRQDIRGRRATEGGLLPMAWGWHIDAEWRMLELGRKKGIQGR